MTVVKMLAKINGTRNGLDWPDVGETIDLPADEAAQLIGQKLAAPGKRTDATLIAADHVDHSNDARIENERIRANLADALAAAKAGDVEVADLIEPAKESTVLTTAKAGKG
jgi:hypothetical protein